MKITVVWICLFLACGSSFGADQDDKAQALADILVQDDDGLPAGVKAAAAKTDQKDAPAILRKMPKAQVFATRSLESEGEMTGSVTVFAYPRPATRASSFKTLSTDMGNRATKLEGVGENAMMVTTVVDFGGQNYSISDIVFVRANRVAFVRLIGKAPAENAKTFAKRLDKRLQETK